MVEISILRDRADLDRLCADWDGLWSMNPDREIFGAHVFASAAWDAREDESSLFLVAAYREDALCGLLPLKKQGRTLRFMASPHSDYNDVLCAPDDSESFEALLGAVHESEDEWDACALDNLLESSLFLNLAEKQQETSKNRWIVRTTKTCASVDFKHDRDQVIDALLAKKKPKQYERRLARFGDVTFRHIEDAGEIQEHFPAFFRQHITRWAMSNVDSYFLREKPRRLFEDLVKKLDPATELRFSALSIDDRPVAYHLGFLCGRKFTFYKPTFDIGLWDFSPGTVLIRKLFEYVAETDIDTFDLTIGGEDYKRRFANREQVVKQALLYADSGSGRALQLRESREEGSACRTPAGLAAAVGRRAKSALGRHGVIGCFLALVRFLKRKVVDTTSVSVFVVAASPGVETAVQLVEADLGELGTYAADHEYLRRRLQKARDRLKKGDHLYLALDGSDLAHIAWVGVKDEVVAAYETGEDCRIPLDEPAAVIYDCWTPPEYRGRGWYPKVLRALVQKYGAEYPQTFIYCLSDNRSSVRGIVKAGFEPFKVMKRTTWFGRFVRNSVR